MTAYVRSPIVASAEIVVIGSRTSADWLHEARLVLSGLAEPLPIRHADEHFAAWVEQWRAWAAQQVLLVADRVLIHGVRQAQRVRRGIAGHARSYGAVTAADAVACCTAAPENLSHFHTARAIASALCLGPRRTPLAALLGAAKRNPPGPGRELVLWKSKGSSGVWRSLGESKDERMARIARQGPRPTPAGARGRGRDGLAR